MSMSQNGVVVRFENVSFHYEENKPLLDEVSFSVRNGSKISIMGQNGAGKSTIFKLMTGGISPEEGEIHIGKDTTIAISRQVISSE